METRFFIAREIIPESWENFFSLGVCLPDLLRTPSSTCFTLASFEEESSRTFFRKSLYSVTFNNLTVNAVFFPKNHNKHKKTYLFIQLTKHLRVTLLYQLHFLEVLDQFICNIISSFRTLVEKGIYQFQRLLLLLLNVHP